MQPTEILPKKFIHVLQKKPKQNKRENPNPKSKNTRKT